MQTIVTLTLDMGISEKDGLHRAIHILPEHIVGFIEVGQPVPDAEGPNGEPVARFLHTEILTTGGARIPVPMTARALMDRISGQVSQAQRDASRPPLVIPGMGPIPRNG